MHLRYILILLFSLASTLALSQSERPKIGLVLSGGSAHGIAHIGVLKLLDDLEIKVDYITGTSMGSIMGGLYAMGLSGEEIEEITKNQSWSELLSTDIALGDVAPSEKGYHNRYGLTLEIRDGGLKLPQGFLSSQKLDLQLNRIFGRSNGINDFNQLPIPFKCVAVNIENGDIEVLDKGYLGNAVRTSMAIPSVFTPVEQDGKLLVDGGLIRNFPVEEVREMGADVVIGVYVGSKLEEKEKLNNLLEILNQSAFMMGILDSEKQKENVDVLIEPDVKHLPSFAFDEIDFLIREGSIAAMSQIEQLRAIAEEQKQYDLTPVIPLPPIDALELADTRFPFIPEPHNSLAAFKYGYYSEGSTPINRVEKGIDRIFGTKHFDNINYTFKTNSRGEQLLTILGQPRSTNSLSAGFNFLPSSGTSLILTNEIRNLIAEPSVLYTTLRFAENYGVKLDYYYRLGKKKNFLLNTISMIHRYDQNLYEGEILRERYAETNYKGGIGIGYEPNNTILVSSNVNVDGFHFKPIGVQEDELEEYERLDFTIEIKGIFNNMDKVQFPDNGIELTVNANYATPISSSVISGNENFVIIPEDRSYYEFSFSGNGAYTPVEGFTMLVDVNMGYQSHPSFTNNFRIGGLEGRNYKSLSMLGLNTHQLHFQNYTKLGGALRFQIVEPIYFSTRVDYLQGDRTFIVIDDLAVKDGGWGIGAIVGVKTPLGPLQLAYGRNSLTSSWNTNFTFGYPFF